MRSPQATYEHEAKRRMALSIAIDDARAAGDHDRAQAILHVLHRADRRVERAQKARLDHDAATREDEHERRRESARGGR